MQVKDAGHRYLVDSYDGGEPLQIQFMKREGPGYPGNVGHYPGTNCQELIRVLIDRIEYLDKQIHDDSNHACLKKLRECLWLFEDRAARRHNIDQFDFFPSERLEELPTCPTCGHIVCHGHATTTH